MNTIFKKTIIIILVFMSVINISPSFDNTYATIYAGANESIAEDTSEVESENSNEDVVEVQVQYKSVFTWLLSLLESAINRVLLAVGDVLLYAVCVVVGENVTLDKVIFGKVNKVKINFWDNEDGKNVAAVMSPVITYWYNIFKTFAIFVYFIVLLYVGIKILLSDTGSSKAKYSSLLVSWVMGLVMLFFYPYVMKYTVMLNQAFLDVLYSEDLSIDKGIDGSSLPTLEEEKSGSNGLSLKAGTDSFPIEMAGGQPGKSQMMMYVRWLSGVKGRIPLTFIYYILIFQLIVILCVYYKRVFMLAFLITIYPLVAMIYTLDKIGKNKTNAFSTWTKEFMINVFVQLFHAVVYVLVVNAGIKSYIASGNWLFMVLCVMFLFQGEKILRSIFGMKSAANTVGDLAAAGVTAFAVAKQANKWLGKSKDEKDKDEKDLDEISEELQQSAPSMQSTSTNNEGAQPEASSSLEESSYRQEESEEEQSADLGDFDMERAKNVMAKYALANKNRSKKSKIGKFAGGVGSIVGAGIGASVGLARGSRHRSTFWSICRKGI